VKKLFDLEVMKERQCQENRVIVKKREGDLKLLKKGSWEKMKCENNSKFKVSWWTK
jgi:hypothetical protein